MKRIAFTLLLILLSLTAWAQKSIALLDKVEGHRVNFHYTYSLSQKGADFKAVTDGDVVLEGNDYLLEGLGLKVISDGTTRWTLDESAGEAVVETVEKDLNCFLLKTGPFHRRQRILWDRMSCMIISFITCCVPVLRRIRYSGSHLQALRDGMTGKPYSNG